VRNVEPNATRRIEFVTASEASLEAFLSASARSRYQPQLREYAESLLRQGCTRPDWCVLGVEDATPVARAALWAMPGQPVPTDIVLIDAEWSEEDLSTEHALLTRVHELAATLGAGALSHSIDSPPAAPQYQENEDARIRLLACLGYELLRDGSRWRVSGSALEAQLPANSLDFRPLPEVGEDSFVKAIAATYQGTRDAWITRNMEEHGALAAATADFRDYQEMQHESEWWELAYTSDGALAGVIIAARNPSTAVIAYIGVVPEKRGRGLARQLVRRGTERLFDSGAEEIRGDCDRDNVAMVKAFERSGYEPFARRRTYQLRLTHSRRSR
jgi:RimJ/RimL family protein N-acetyltransferase